MKKYRHQHGLFIVEGKKMVNEAITSGWDVQTLIVREDMVEKFDGLYFDIEVCFAGQQDFARLSSQPSPEGVLAVVKFPAPDFCETCQPEILPEGPGFILDAIQDPGNLGTIMRIADWFGFPRVIFGLGTSDLLNPRSLRSTMGAVFRVNVMYVENIAKLISTAPDRVLIADLEGQPLENITWQGNEFVVIGNEANGVSEEIRALAGLRKVSIPGEGGAESLNAGVSAGIFAWNLRYSRK
ncbi:MAG: RNA methyltransferase [Bacteroidia bacterium]